MHETLDHFLGGRLQLFQPTEGYRAGIDPLFLSASVHPKSGEKILDVGAGSGIASLALALRCQDITVTGLEIQQELVDLASRNRQINHLVERVNIIQGDILTPPSPLLFHSFDQIMTNPPFYEERDSQPSPHPHKALAKTETLPLQQWLTCCLKMLKTKGTFTMIHRPERLPEILSYLENKVGGLVIYPLWPSSHTPARRIVIQGRKGMKGELRLARGMILHGENEKYTPETDAILRDMAGLIL